MNVLRNFLLLSMFCYGNALISTASAQDIPDPGGDEITVIDAAVIAFDTQSDLKCDCSTPDDATTFERCLDKMKRKALAAFKQAVKFNQESLSDLKTALSDEQDSLVTDCQEMGDTPPDDSGGDPNGEPPPQ